MTSVDKTINAKLKGRYANWLTDDTTYVKGERAEFKALAGSKSAIIRHNMNAQMQGFDVHT